MGHSVITAIGCRVAVVDSSPDAGPTAEVSGRRRIWSSISASSDDHWQLRTAGVTIVFGA